MTETSSSVTLTGPDRCAQCGTEFDMEAILAEAVATGTSEAVKEAYVTIRGHQIGIPGLYRCAECAAGIKSGELESTLTYQAAKSFLDDIWGPGVVAANLKAVAMDRDELAAMAALRLGDVLEVSEILEAVIEAVKDDPNGLDSIPECDGHCHEHAEGGQDQAKAHLS